MLIGVTRSRRSKGIQYNGQNEKGQKDKQRSTNNYTENEISIYTNSRWTQVHISQGRAYKLNIRLLYDGKCIIHSINRKENIDYLFNHYGGGNSSFNLIPGTSV
jgi:predicted  nucleic acid-binding Zn-ribbon protein